MKKTLNLLFLLPCLVLLLQTKTNTKQIFIPQALAKECSFPFTNGKNPSIPSEILYDSYHKRKKNVTNINATTWLNKILIKTKYIVRKISLHTILRNKNKIEDQFYIDTKNIIGTASFLVKKFYKEKKTLEQEINAEQKTYPESEFFIKMTTLTQANENISNILEKKDFKTLSLLFFIIDFLGIKCLFEPVYIKLANDLDKKDYRLFKEQSDNIKLEVLIRYFQSKAKNYPFIKIKHFFSNNFKNYLKEKNILTTDETLIDCSNIASVISLMRKGIIPLLPRLPGHKNNKKANNIEDHYDYYMYLAKERFGTNKNPNFKAADDLYQKEYNKMFQEIFPCKIL